MTKHTELPWEVDKENVHAGQICSCHGDADTWYEVWTPNWQNGIDQQANAEFIVKACNNHYQLLDALKGLLARAEQELADPGDVSEVYSAQQAIKAAS